MNEPKLAKAFPTAEAVNESLRGLLALADEKARIKGRSKCIARKRVAAQFRRGGQTQPSAGPGASRT